MSPARDSKEVSYAVNMSMNYDGKSSNESYVSNNQRDTFAYLICLFICLLFKYRINKYITWIKRF